MGAACALWLFCALWITRDHYPVSPDTLHHGIVARNLARGNGFTINMIHYHVGQHAEVEHVPEMHAILQPVALAGLFALFGPEQAMFRVPGFTYMALTGFVAFLYARRGFGAGAGLVACTLTLASSLLAQWAWIGSDDAGFAFWFLVAVFALDVAIEKRSARGFALAGLAAALALLQKLSGMILLAPMLAIALNRETSVRTRLRWTASWLAPFALAFGLNAVRNRIASGGWGFRFGSIGWIYKTQGIEAYYGVYDPIPSLASVLGSIGSERVISVIRDQLEVFARAVLSPTPVFAVDPLNRLMAPGFLSLLALLALAIHARRRPRFAVLATLSLLGSVGFICGIWHYEIRYFTQLVPLFAISISGSIVPKESFAQPRRQTAFAMALSATGLAIVALSVGLFARSLQTIPLFGGAAACSRALAWIRSETAPNDRILTIDPWTTTWETQRASIVVPFGPREDVEKVIAWYHPTWLLVQPRLLRPRSTQRIQEMLANPTATFSASPVLVDGACSVHRITTSIPDQRTKSLEKS